MVSMVSTYYWGAKRLSRMMKGLLDIKNNTDRSGMTSQFAASSEANVIRSSMLAMVGCARALFAIENRLLVRCSHILLAWQTQARHFTVIAVFVIVFLSIFSFWPRAKPSIFIPLGLEIGMFALSMTSIVVMRYVAWLMERKRMKASRVAAAQSVATSNAVLDESGADSAFSQNSGMASSVTGTEVASTMLAEQSSSLAQASSVISTEEHNVESIGDRVHSAHMFT